MPFDERPQPIGRRDSRARRRRGRTVPPSSVIPNTSHGPIIQPMSLTQYIVSPALDVEAVHHVLRGLDREAAMRVHGALRAGPSCPTCR